MLPAFIIEEIKRREQERRRQDQRPHVDLPLEPPRPDRDDPPDLHDPERRDRHDDDRVVTIDLG